MAFRRAVIMPKLCAHTTDWWRCAVRRCLTWVRRGGVGFVVATALVAVSSLSAHATESTDNAGPLNVDLVAGANAAGGVNESLFVAIETNGVPVGAVFSATATIPSGTIEVPVYALPVGGSNPLTGANNATVWVPTPTDATDIRLSWSPGGVLETYGTKVVEAGSSITVTQDTEGLGAITVTAQFPRFSGLVAPSTPVEISKAFFELPSADGGFGNYGFYVFDADTREVITPERPGVRKRWISDSVLEIVDPLVLPDSALGRNIRVGFLTYFYMEDYGLTGVMPIRYAGLSSAILMRLRSSAASSATLAAMQQFAVPAGTEAQVCGSLAPEHVDAPALRQMRDEGWSVSYAQWPNDGQGGWVCSRQPVLTSQGWVVR